jgi:hypothetical protein
MRALLLTVLLLSACADDTSTRVNVAPSAEPKMDDILEAVERLNREIGEDTYALQAVDSEERVDGVVIIRASEELGRSDEQAIRIGNTKKTHEGVVVRIVALATPSAIAHELGHAAGLSHVDDPTNLMYPVTAPNRWGLNEDQLEILRERF